MSTLTSLGVGSGLDVETIVSQLVAAERSNPERRIKASESKTNAQISAFGSVKSNLTALQDALKKLTGAGSSMGRAVTLAEGTPFTATANTLAPLGTFTLTVDRLATAHKLQTPAMPKDAVIGHGTLTITTGTGDPLEVTVLPEDNTLTGIASSINNAAGGSGITAAVVRGDSGDVLVLTSSKTGTEGKLTITSSGGDGGLSTLNTTGGILTETQAPVDALVTIDGVQRSSSSNTLTDLVTGMSITLTKADPGKTHSLSVTSDSKALKESLKAFITAYNDSLGQISKQSVAGGVVAGVQQTAGALSGDATTRALASALRGQMTANYAELSKLGLKTGVDGKLTLDESKFDAFVATTPDAVGKLFGEEAPLGKGLTEVVKNYIGVDGLLTAKNKALNEKLESLTDDMDDLDLRMAAIEANYRRQFAALDTLMGSMSSAQSFVQQLVNRSNS